MTDPGRRIPVFAVTDNATQEQAVSGTQGHVPKMRPGSVRRTTSIDMTWSDSGDPFNMKQHLHGRARDVRAGDGWRPGDPRRGRDRRHRELRPGDRGDQRVALARRHRGSGRRGGSQLRGAIDEVLPGEREAGTPLHLLLDDLAGCTLIAGFVWARFMPDLVRARSAGGEEHRKRMEGVCTGFAPGSSALSPDRDPR